MYIGPHGVAALHRHKYSGVDHSYVAKYVLQPFWSWFVTLFPLWMPPNLITLTGFMFLLISALLGYIYSPQLDSAPPRWVHVAHGLLLFLYQTFDAIDGKQARRTNSSSPLGELFDHGCDALACALEALAFGSTAMCGRATFWWWLISAVTFFGATWEYYFINTLILPVVNGPTEGLMLIYLAHFFTAFVGAEWWVQQFGKSLPFLNWLPFIAGKTASLYGVLSIFETTMFILYLGQWVKHLYFLMLFCDNYYTCTPVSCIRPPNNCFLLFLFVFMYMQTDICSRNHLLCEKY
jgi:ethanolaminephosphotransferase